MSLMRQLSTHGLTAKIIGLEGRFHSSVHRDAVESINKLCESNNDLQFPTAKNLLVPLRSNSDAQVITGSSLSLHQIALKSIMMQQCNWHLTIAAATSQGAGKENLSVLTVGLVDC